MRGGDVRSHDHLKPGKFPSWFVVMTTVLDLSAWFCKQDRGFLRVCMYVTVGSHPEGGFTVSFMLGNVAFLQVLQ